MERHSRMAIGNCVRGRLSVAGLSMPEFRFFAGHAKRGIDCCFAVRPVVYVIEVSIRKLAMDEEDIRVACRLGVAEVRSQLHRGQRVEQRHSGVDLASSNRTYPGACT